MKCADPILCYTDTKGKRKYRHYTLASPIFIKLLHQQVFNCGKCLFCRKKRSYELACKCVLHASLYKQNSFLTLTYDEKKENYHNKLEYSDIQKFKKRLRQYAKRKYGKRIEIFNVHEYGKNGKKHWHLIVFNFDFPDKTVHTYKNSIPLYTSKILERLWGFGFNTIGDVTEASAMYQSQYMEKDIKNNNLLSSRKSKSNHSGIGRSYFLSNFRQILQLGYVPINGKRLPLPRSFEKIADRHFCHFYNSQAFYDTAQRKAIHRKFKKEKPNLELANLYMDYKEIREIKIKELESQWDEYISNLTLTDNYQPDFIKSEKNKLHDMRNNNNQEIF